MVVNFSKVGIYKEYTCQDFACENLKERFLEVSQIK